MRRSCLCQNSAHELLFFFLSYCALNKSIRISLFKKIQTIIGTVLRSGDTLGHGGSINKVKEMGKLLQLFPWCFTGF